MVVASVEQRARMPGFACAFRRAVILFVGALAAACTLVPPPVEPAMREAAAAFVFTGRLSATDGERSAAGRLEWQHRPSADRWTVYSPLGQIVARIEDGPEGAALTLADGTRHRAAQAADLMPAFFPGMADAGLPLARLAAWVQAAPPAGSEVRTLDAQGRPARLIDQGWSIDYLDYQDGTAVALPRRLDIFRDVFRLRLVIEQWETETEKSIEDVREKEKDRAS
ncbi:MAG: lipoprotein insertase outer membrane protein LolB [Azoarcus sp.]|nr:lipoprotein insertase outer membrane protein LolB [Azoarcus sp.]